MMIHRKDAEAAEIHIFLLSADLPSLKLWQGKEGGKQKQSACFWF
jgi:hypothetical protein